MDSDTSSEGWFVGFNFKVESWCVIVGGGGLRKAIDSYKSVNQVVEVREVVRRVNTRCIVFDVKLVEVC